MLNKSIICIENVVLLEFNADVDINFDDFCNDVNVLIF